MRFVPGCLILTLLFVGSAERGNAQIGPSKGQAAAILGGLLVGAAALGIGTAYLISHNRGVTTGCVSETGGKKTFISESQKPYSLLESGQVLSVGERYKLKGRKSGSFSAPVFTVERMLKDLGRCP